MNPIERGLLHRAGVAVLIGLALAGLSCSTAGSRARELEQEKNLKRAKARYNLGLDHLSNPLCLWVVSSRHDSLCNQEPDARPTASRR